MYSINGKKLVLLAKDLISYVCDTVRAHRHFTDDVIFHTTNTKLKDTVSHCGRLPEVGAHWLADEIEEDTCRVKDAQRANGRHVGGQDVTCVHA